MKNRYKVVLGYFIFTFALLLSCYFLIQKGIGTEENLHKMSVYFVFYLIYGYGAFLLFAAVTSLTLWYYFIRSGNTEMKLGFKMTSVISAVLILILSGMIVYVLKFKVL